MQLHLSVFLWGFTAILGELIQLQALQLVWWRIAITILSLIILLQVFYNGVDFSLKYVKKYAFIGICIALHWLCFYGAIKYANASIALICMATSSLFTSLIEPLVVKRKFSTRDLIFGLLVIPGMYFVIDSTALEMQKGIWVGLLAAFLAAYFTSLNKKYLIKGKEMEITFVELLSALLFLTCILPFLYLANNSIEIIPRNMDWMYLCILAIVCTTLPFILSLKALNQLSAFSANLIVNLEPVYGIILAALLLNQHNELSNNFYLGVILILIVVILYPIITIGKTEDG